MKVAIIPDVHEKLDRLDNLVLDDADHEIYLGDWFDSFAAFDEDRIRHTCDIINNLAQREDVTLLLGNHDVHYFFDNTGYTCSGYELRKKRIIKHLIPEETILKFKVFTRVGPYLVSHAGFCEGTLQYATDLVANEAIRTSLAGGYDALFGAGKARGGYQKFGGPTWLDFNYEFEHIDDIPQIVGHTQDKAVRAKGKTQAASKVDEDGNIIVDVGLMSYCIDTGLRHWALVDDETGAIEIIDNNRELI